MNYKKYVFELEDIQSIDAGLLFPEEIDLKPVKMWLIGFLIKEEKDFYVVAKEIWETNQCKYIHLIPKRFVLKKKELN